jgi:hypothetical protein
MVSAYRSLLRLYPAAYRAEFGEEMAGVFGEVQSKARVRGHFRAGSFYIREVMGLLFGALEEHARAIAGSRPWAFSPLLSFSSRRFRMRSEFRFPKSTAVLMVLILAGVILAIEKATAIQESLPYANPHLPPIQSSHFTLFPAMAVIFFSAYAAAVIGWAMLFALRRSGVHRLSEMPAGEARK